MVLLKKDSMLTFLVITYKLRIVLNYNIMEIKNNSDNIYKYEF